MPVELRPNRNGSGKRYLDSRFLDDVEAGLSSRPKAIPLHWSFDEAGVALLDRLHRQPSYYLHGLENALLNDYADNIATYSKGAMTLVEFMPHEPARTRHVVESLLVRQGHVRYVPVDFSGPLVSRASRTVLSTYSRLVITSYVGDLHNAAIHFLARIPEQKMICLLGSALGEFHEDEILALLSDIARSMKSDDYVLLGVDMAKDVASMEEAYNDPAGVWKALNMNLLQRVNNELGGQFNLDDFSYEALYTPERSRIDIQLRARMAGSVFLGKAGKSFPLDYGETIWTQSAYKFTFPQISELVLLSGFELVNLWQDVQAHYALVLLRKKQSDDVDWLRNML